MADAAVGEILQLLFFLLVWFGCTQAVARDPSKPLAEIMQDNCALWSPNRQFAVTGMEVAWHGVLLLCRDRLAGRCLQAVNAWCSWRPSSRRSVWGELLTALQAGPGVLSLISCQGDSSCCTLYT
ncbi:hypothetical protein ROHU_011839 [Labeo rohita]|uniref:Uncharacterized protein n=1 Tax=Labeo rohita TaxID=84645 RepID=A0A498LH24_LABRO|nr:hypothetical protein ROHU_011839 [Labeo rohita]